MRRRSGSGQGMCQNSAVRKPGPPLAQVLRHERQVVVVEEHRTRPSGASTAADLGEPAVHGLVGIPVLGAEDGPHVRLVAQRPERVVGEAGVVPLVLLAASARCGAAGRRARRAASRSSCRSSTTARSALPAPCAIHTPPRSRISASSATDTPPGVGRTRIDAVRRVVVNPGLAVRHDDEPAAGAADLLHLAERRPEEDRADELVQRDDRDDERLEPAAPVGILVGGEHGRARARCPPWSSARATAGATRVYRRRADARARAACPSGRATRRTPERPTAVGAERRQRIEVDGRARRPRRTARGSACAPRSIASRRTSPADADDVLHDDASRHRREQRLEVPPAAQRRQHDAQRRPARASARARRNRRYSANSAPTIAPNAHDPRISHVVGHQKPERRAALGPPNASRADFHAEAYSRMTTRVREHDERHAPARPAGRARGSR